MPTEFIIAISIVLSIYTFIIIYKGFVMIPKDKIGIIEKFGAFHKIVEPGMHFIFPLRDRVKIMSLDDKITYNQTIDLSSNVTYVANLEVYYHVDQIKKFAYGRAPDQILSRIQKHIKDHYIHNEANIDEEILMEDIINDMVKTHEIWGITIQEVKFL
jgi:regulator of protease activity HflC (stomatin/prohibitin superfamily)